MHNNEHLYFEANRQSWNKRTAVHKDSTFYNLDAFKAGHTSLNNLEVSELGEVTGKSLLHLQCHFGLDTLSWARLGAEVTGIDFSPEAVYLAQTLSRDLAIPAKFICCNVYDLPEQLQQKFDIVFTSYGVIGWLPDLTRWAQVIRRFLQPGGTFYMAEFHPVVWMMDENFERIKYAYHNHGVIEDTISGTYTDRQAPITSTEFTWNHSLAEVINALIGQGLQIQLLNEHSYSCYNCFNNMVQGADGLYRIKGLEDKVPIMYSIKATLPA